MKVDLVCIHIDIACAEAGKIRLQVLADKLGLSPYHLEAVMADMNNCKFRECLYLICLPTTHMSHSRLNSPIWCHT
jgi:hypothetical protein